MNDIHRPITSKARGVCKYYTAERGCFAAEKCKFLHSTEPAIHPSGARPPVLTPFDKAKRCRFFTQGFCKRGDKCWFLHVPPQPSVIEQPPESEDEDLCSVCFEKPPIYGLLGGCSHIFCLDCIRKWRDPCGKSSDISNIKRCPMCRAKCRYVIPSSRFRKDGEEKERIVQQYRNSMCKVPCKYFAATKEKNSKKPMCPFGSDCFYQHLNTDGSPYILKHGMVKSMQAWRGRRRAFGFNEDLDGAFITAEASESEMNAVNLAGSIAMDMFDRMVAEVMESADQHVAAERGNQRTTGSGRGRSRRRGPFDEAALNRARMEMVAGAVSTIRAQIGLQGPLDGGNMRPIVIPGTLSPQMQGWDFDGDVEGIDNGWGWNDLVTDVAHNADIDLTERLEVLADHMLGSLRIVRGRDTESSPPPLEPIGRQRTPPPLRGDAVVTDEDDGEMPALQSVSNTSESEGSDSDRDDDDDFFVGDLHDGIAHARSPARDLAHNIAEAHTPSGSLTEAGPSTEASSRFRIVVGREEERTVIPIHEEVGVTTLDELDAEETGTADTQQPVVVMPAEPPPFVTDGRGRVVWSNKDSEEVPVQLPEEPQEEVQTQRSLLERIYSHFF